MRFKLHFLVTPGAIHEPPEDEICRRLLEVVAKIEHEGVTDYNEPIRDENDIVIGDYARKTKINKGAGGASNTAHQKTCPRAGGEPERENESYE